MKSRAFIGDIHGCIDELKSLFKLLKTKGVDEIWHVGDLVDRGPDSGAVVRFCRENGIRGVLGNHESSILPYQHKLTPLIPQNPEKNRSCYSIQSEADWDYLKSLPPLHVFDEDKIILVHGGIYPHLPLYAQPKEAIIRLQLIHPEHIGVSKWFDKDKEGVLEEVYRNQGWRRWYEMYDLPYDIVYGHSVYQNPHITGGTEGRGRTIGIDTGICFGGRLTAVILPDFDFVSVPAKKVYFKSDKSWIVS